jgi:hypothetical protein
MTDTFVLDPTKIRDIAPDVLDDTGRLRVLPAAYWATTTAEERALLGHRHGLYSFPTVELVEHLRNLINGRPAIEIGAGHGVLAQALDIPATDSREQDKPEYRLLYAMQGQPPVRYGPNVVEAEARRAVRRYRPDVVIGCWVTQNYVPDKEWVAGDSKLNGIDEFDIIRQCATYVVVGNEHVHRNKRIWRRPHTIEYPPYVYSRAQNGSRDFIATWPGGGSRKPR